MITADLSCSPAAEATSDAAPPMAPTPPRLDLYAGIHKALRLAMSETLARTGSLDPADRTQLAEVIGQVRTLCAMCRSHLHKENTYVHPAIEATYPGGSRHIAAEHEEHGAAIDGIATDTAALEADPSPLIAHRLYRRLALFVAENFQHMEVEEAVHNAALWSAYSDAELLQLHLKIVGSIGPAEMSYVLHWMLPALSPEERIELMQGLRATAPAPAFESALQVARWRLALAVASLAVLAACGGGGSVETPADPATPADPDSGSPPPIRLSAAGSSARSASLAWTPVQGATGYRLERKSADAAWTPIATLSSADHSYLDDGLVQETTYTYRVVAIGTSAAAAEQTATTTDREPLVTDAAALLGTAPDYGSLGAGGGSITSADGKVRLTVPAGTVSANTAVTMQRTTNPLPAGLGQGLLVTIAAPTLQPLTLVLRYEAAEDARADGMGVAMQRADGSWLALPVTALDRAERTLTVSVPPALLAKPAIARAGSATAAAASAVSSFKVVRYLNLYLSPPDATMPASDSQLLVPYAHAEVQPGWADPDLGCLTWMVLEKREIPFDNVKPGFTRKWYVFADEGGTPALGTVTPRAGTGAVYRAPSVAPAPNPVTVSFVSRNDKTGRKVTLSSTILVREPVWTMTMAGTLDGAQDIGFSYSAQAVWTRVPGDAEVYRASGTQSVHVIDIVCVATASPDTVELPPGALTIDRSVQPARYTLNVGSVWDTLVSGSCPGGSVANVPARVPGNLVVEGTLGANGTRIEGSIEQNHVRWTWALTNQL